MTTMARTSNWLALRLSGVRSESGASLVEYAFLMALIAIVCIAAVTLLGEETSSKFDSMADSLANS